MFPWSYLSHVHNCRLMLAEDDGGGGGSGGGGSDDPTDAPKMLPCPFSGSTDLDDSGDVIVCRTNGVSGPVPEDGQTKVEAWNKRASDDEETSDDDAPEEMPDADPAATAAGFKSLDSARKAYIALANKANIVHGKLGAAQRNAKTAVATADKARKASVAAIREKVGAEQKLTAVSKERDELKSYKAAEPQRLNAEVQRTLAASGHPQIAQQPNNQPGGGPKEMSRKNFNNLSQKARMEFVRSKGKITE